MAVEFYKNVTLDQFLHDEAVHARVFRFLVLKCSEYFTLWRLPILEGIRGMEPQDIVSEAIELVVAPDTKFDPQKGSLVGYLLFNLIRSRVANLAANADVKREVAVAEHSDSILDQNRMGESLDSHLELVLNRVAESVKGDVDAENILMGRVDGMKRGEIMEEFGLDAGRYLNGYRRLMSKVDALGKEGLKQYLL